MKQIIKNINKVEFIDATRLRDITLIHDEGLERYGVLFNYWRNWQELPLTGLAEVVETATMEDKELIYEVKLTANLQRHPDIANRHLCYKVTAVDGSQYLIGMDEAPYPVASTSYTMSGSTAEKSGCTLTVTYKNTFGLLEVTD